MAAAVDMRAVAPTVSQLSNLRSPSSSEVPPLREIVADMGAPEALAVVVFDGFGSEALKLLGPSCPIFRSIYALHHRDIFAVRPPKTPVNFATMVTGASPSVHGVTSKTDELELETVFRVFSEAGMSTCVAGRRSGSPAHLFSRFAGCTAIAPSNTDSEVLELAVKRLKDNSPTFTLVQFLDIDETGHRSGPFSDEASKAVRRTDRRLGRLMRALSSLQAGIIVLADHGQHEVRVEEGGEETIRGKHDGTRPEDFSVPLAWANPDELSSLWKNPRLV